MKSHPAEGLDQLSSFITFDDLPKLTRPVKVEQRVFDDLAAVPKQKLLETKDLKLGRLSQYETGEMIELPDGTQVRLIRLRHLEHETFYADPKLIVRQPRQPRNYFNPQTIQKTAGSIAVRGQLEAAHVVPVLFPDNTCRLMLIEGERRFRIILNLGLPRLKITTDWVRDEQELFETSYTINLKEQHTIFEDSDAFVRMIAAREKKGMSRSEAIEDASRIAQKSPDVFKTYLKLQRITPEAREILVDRVGLTGAEAIVDAINKVIGDVDQVAMAKSIVENPVFASRGPNVGSLSLAYVRQASTNYLTQTGRMSPREKQHLAADNLLGEIRRAITIAARAVLVFGKQPDLIPLMVAKLKLRGDDERSRSPNYLMEDIDDIREGLRDFCSKVLEPSTKIAMLEKPAAALKFRDHVENRMKTLRGNPFHERLIRILAHISDSEKQTPLTAAEIARVLTDKGFSSDSVMVSNNLQHGELPERIRQMGFELDIHEVFRRRGGKVLTAAGRTESHSVLAYRLRWNDEMLRKRG